jgi:hypothetical protein
MVQVTFMIDHKIFSTVIRTMYRSYQFLAKVKATSTGKLLVSMPRNNAVAELCSGKFKVAYCRDPE